MLFRMIASGFHSSLSLSDDFSGNSGTGRIENIETINAGEGDDIIDLTSPDALRRSKHQEWWRR